MKLQSFAFGAWLIQDSCPKHFMELAPNRLNLGKYGSPMECLGLDPTLNQVMIKWEFKSAHIKV